MPLGKRPPLTLVVQGREKSDHLSSLEGVRLRGGRPRLQGDQERDGKKGRRPCYARLKSRKRKEKAELRWGENELTPLERGGGGGGVRPKNPSLWRNELKVASSEGGDLLVKGTNPHSRPEKKICRVPI